MPDVSEVRLPGVGVRHEFTTAGGERVGVLSHRSGRRELVVYDRRDPDVAMTVLHLDGDDTRTLAELLGATQVSEALTSVQQVEGLAIDWIAIPDGSRFADATIADGAFRTRTGASVVAVVRGTSTIAAPGPDHQFEAGDAALVFIELGGVALALSILARVAGRLGITAIPFYLLAGLAVGEGGIAPLDLSADFIGLTAEIGVLLLLLTLGLEYTGDELRYGLRTGAVPGLADAALNFAPGFAMGLLLGWGTTAALLLGGVCWISSSGVVSKVLNDLDRLGNRETPAVLNLLVIEDLAMAAYLPVVAALVAGRAFEATATTVAIALVGVTVILGVALRWGDRLSALLAPASDEALLLAVFGITLLVSGLAQQVEVSAAIGAFLVGLALSGPVQARAGPLIHPLRDLCAAIFFLFFSFQVRPASLVSSLVPALVLVVFGVAGKLAAGWVACRHIGVSPRARLRAGSALIARGEFSIVIASLGATIAHGDDLGALAAAFVLMSAIVGPVVAKYADSLPLVRTSHVG